MSTEPKPPQQTASSSHRARKRFGQNFLHDPFVISRIVKFIAPQANDTMVEIGPGKGALTEQLLRQLNTLQAIEIDRDLIDILQQKFSHDGKLHIHSADALSFDYARLLDANSGKKLRLIGNLPYNISTPLIFHLLSFRDIIDDMHFMLQLELVQRLAAKPGNKTYGRLSVHAQYYCQIDNLFEVSPGAFTPAPKVKSAIVRLIPREKPELTAQNPQLFEQLLRCAFSMRRKTLRNNLKALVNTEQLELIDGDLQRRPEQLSVTEFVMLSNQINQLLITSG